MLRFHLVPVQQESLKELTRYSWGNEILNQAYLFSISLNWPDTWPLWNSRKGTLCKLMFVSFDPR